MLRSRNEKETKSLSSVNSKVTFQLPGIFLIVGLLVIGLVARFLPYPPNFSPIGAIALFAGATLGSRLRAALIPLTAMFLSDLWLGMHTLMPVVYGCFLFNVWLGSRIQSRLRLLPIAGMSIAGATFFFIVTNGACWFMSYPATWAGMVSCYTLAIPFFQNTLMGDLFFSAVLFGSLALAQWRFPALRPVGLSSGDASVERQALKVVEN
jgi:hypothetical protein